MRKKDDFQEKLGGENYRVSLEAWPNYFNHEDTLFNSIQKRIGRVSWKNDFRINVLEAGSGTGITTIRLALLNTRTFVSAVDSSKKMNGLANDLISGLTDRVNFYHDDIVRFLEKTSVRYHIFCSAKMLHNFVQPKWQLTISLAFDSLVDGGIFALADFIARDDEAQYEEDYKWEVEQMAPLKKKDEKLYSRWIKHYQRDRAKKIRESDLIAHLKKVGFQDIKIDYRHHMDAIATAVK